MPYDEENPKKNIAGATRALRLGGAELAELTGEDEVELPQANIFRDGFRRLTGAARAPRMYGNTGE